MADTPTQYLWQIKLYHPDERNGCRQSETSERIQAYLPTDSEESAKPLIRQLTEGHQHEYFRGDRCIKCGALAKVSFTLIRE